MTVIHRDRATESRPGHYVTEASDLGWTPGQWPSQVEFKGQTLTRGNLQTDTENEIVGAMYANPSQTLTLMVYND